MTESILFLACDYNSPYSSSFLHLFQRPVFLNIPGATTGNESDISSPTSTPLDLVSLVTINLILT